MPLWQDPFEFSGSCMTLRTARKGYYAGQEF